MLKKSYPISLQKGIPDSSGAFQGVSLLLTEGRRDKKKADPKTSFFFPLNRHSYPFEGAVDVAVGVVVDAVLVFAAPGAQQALAPEALLPVQLVSFVDFIGDTFTNVFVVAS